MEEQEDVEERLMKNKEWNVSSGGQRSTVVVWRYKTDF